MTENPPHRRIAGSTTPPSLETWDGVPLPLPCSKRERGIEVNPHDIAEQQNTPEMGVFWCLTACRMCRAPNPPEMGGFCVREPIPHCRTFHSSGAQKYTRLGCVLVLDDLSLPLARHLQNTRFVTPESQIIGPKISTCNIIVTFLCTIVWNK